MPNIYDNIDRGLLPALRQSLTGSERADFCIGYFNLRGWREIGEQIDHFAGGDAGCCRVLIGMHRSGLDDVREALRFDPTGHQMDNSQLKRLTRELAAEFRQQLMLGTPTNTDEAALRRLAGQIKAGKARVKLFLRHQLHAKLYLCFPNTVLQPAIGFVGSSNLTFSGLSGQGELNVDVKDDDACAKLAAWFNDRWCDRWCVDVSDELVRVIDESWAREALIPPYHIYLKMAWHLAHDARVGQAENELPADLRGILFDYQAAAVKMATTKLERHGGVMIGDVVGLGKTLMATALARLMAEKHGYETLVLCPRNLTTMWEDSLHRYGLRRCKVLSITRAVKQLPTLRRYRLVLIDESHNLRNRKGKRYAAIRDYIGLNDAHCILLSATPYNKVFLDLSNQLRLFLDEDTDLGIRPEALLKEIGELKFNALTQASPRSLRAFEHSQKADDWRALLHPFLVRRTRSFVKQHYALADCLTCGAALAPEHDACPACATARTTTERRYLRLADGRASYFPDRVPRTIRFGTTSPTDPYARLYSAEVVAVLENLHLPRYGLGGYISAGPKQPADPWEAKLLDGLSRAGKRLKGFCRTNLFKRLESSGEAFLRSLERHALRNLLFLHALDNGLPLPIGAQNADLLDPETGADDEDRDPLARGLFDVDDDGSSAAATPVGFRPRSRAALTALAATVYATYRALPGNRFQWIRADLFRPALRKHLLADAEALLRLVQEAGTWDATTDAKLGRLLELLTTTHPTEKVLVFTQFADTVRYLRRALRGAGLTQGVAAVTGATNDPTAVAWRFSPVSNGRRDTIAAADEVRVLLTTDVLSEGQNLQDAHLVVNYDLPWALIRLVQRAGRVDRIGQQAERITAYSFMPAEGVEKIIKLRQRIQQRLHENAEVVGSDEAFFDDDDPSNAPRTDLLNLYNEKSGALDGSDGDDQEVDLSSQAFAIWQGALARAGSGAARLRKTIEEMPDVVFSTKAHALSAAGPAGALVYVRTALGTDALAWVDEHGRSVTESPLAILKAAECEPDTPALPRRPDHHPLVRQGVELVHREGRAVGGQLGRRTGARFRTYERLSAWARENPVFATDEVRRAVQALYQAPLTTTAAETLNRHLRDTARATDADETLAALTVALHADDRLVARLRPATDGSGDDGVPEPHIICSLGLKT